MTTEFENRYAVGPNEVKRFNTSQLRNEFLIENLMQNDKISWVYSHYERFMTGGSRSDK